MAKRVSNKKAKQMICDVVLQGRKAIWYGEESEVYAAQSAEQIEKYFGTDSLEEMREGLKKGESKDFVISRNWRYWWTPCICEKEWGNGKYITRGVPVRNKKGELIEHYEALPLICGVYGDSETVAQVTTSYN
ncbi:hypothetical protein [Vibrio sp. TRT 17S01]|uniref:hypothetical protein n=1 Tax=Vibrio sp. TRT 17S01 TaxID=3418505 RepID=UPI003CF451C9